MKMKKKKKRKRKDFDDMMNQKLQQHLLIEHFDILHIFQKQVQFFAFFFFFVC